MNVVHGLESLLSVVDDKAEALWRQALPDVGRDEEEVPQELLRQKRQEESDDRERVHPTLTSAESPISTFAFDI